MRGISTLLVACLWVAALGGIAHADRASAAAHFKQGTALYALEDWDGAIKEFQAGFKDDPNPAFLFNIAQAHRQANRLEDAQRFYERYLELSPKANDRADVEKLIRALESSIEERRRVRRAPPSGVGLTPATPPAPVAAPVAPIAPMPTERPRPDAVGIGLTAAGVVTTLLGISLAAVGAVLDGQAHDRGARLDLAERESLVARGDATAVTGYVAIGAGVGLTVGGIVKLTRRPPRRPSVAVGVAGAPGYIGLSLGGRL